MNNQRPDQVKNLRRRIYFALILLMISTGSFCRLKGTENLRAIEIVSLLVIGMLMGITLVLVIQYFRLKKDPR